MNWSDIDRNPSPRKVRQFAAIWLVVLGAVAAWRWTDGRPTAEVFAIAVAAVAGGAIGILFPRAFRPVFVGLTMATFPIGWAVSRLVLAIVFYGVVTPVGLLMRLTGRDPLQRKRRSGSQWTVSGGSKRMSGYLRQF